VDGFTDTDGIRHLPGEVVDLPESYKGETWLKPLEEKAEASIPPLRAEPVSTSEKPVEIHLEQKKPRRRASRV
jgi:hypothetical protein